jgi:asparagine synthase (glutamine-hydrolysing)
MRAEVTRGVAGLIESTDHRVILNGTGGDEMNAQALNLAIPIADQLAHLRWGKVGKQLIDWSLLTRRPVFHLLFEALLEFMPLHVRALLVERGRLQPWIGTKFAKKFRIRDIQLEDLRGTWFWRPGPRDSAQTIMTLSRDLTCAAPSRLEQRYPYLDQELVEFLTSIPFDQLLRPGCRRYLMRRALAHLLPPEVRERITKVSASRCYPLTLQKHWWRVEHALSQPLSSLLGYIERDALYEDLAQLRDGIVPLHLVRLLKALSLELWLRDVQKRGIVNIPPLSAQKPLLDREETDVGRESLTRFDPQRKGGDYHAGIR